MPALFVWLQSGLEQLVEDALHALHRGMAVLLVDVVKLYELYAVVAANLAHRLVDGLSQL